MVAESIYSGSTFKVTGRNRLTPLDRTNVNRLVQMFDTPFSEYRATQKTTAWVKYLRDEELLISYGFSFGFTRCSMFAVDNEGYTWQVWAEGGGYRKASKTLWRRSLMTDATDGRFGPSENGMSFERFYNLFSTRKEKNS